MLAVSEADRGSLGAQLADQVVVHRAGRGGGELPRRRPGRRGREGHRLRRAASRLRLPLRAARAVGRVRGGGRRSSSAPPAEAMRRSGDKATARALAQRARRADQRGLRRDRERGGGPRDRRRDRLPGAAQGRRPAAAAAGCGWSRARPSWPAAWASGSRRGARQAFGDGRLFVERYVRARPPRRGAGARRRRTGNVDPPRPPRLHAAAPLPEAGRGGARARPARRRSDARSSTPRCG